MSVKFTILGCGSSLGIPAIDGNFGNCDPKNNKNYRTRCSALISIKKYNILIDTSPDIKLQLLKSTVVVPLLALTTCCATGPEETPSRLAPLP